MSQRIGIGLGLVVFLTLNAVVMMGGSRSAPEAAHLKKSQADEIQVIRSRFRLLPMFIMGEPLSLIGSLTKFPFWTKVLPLTTEQAQAITKLDELVREARVLSWHIDAEYPADDLASYQKYVARSDARRSGVVRHAKQMVALGLLTVPQAAFVTHHYLSHKRQFSSLNDKDIQNLLEVTDRQKEKLAQVMENAREKNARLNWFAVHPEEQNEIKAKRAEIEQVVDAAAKEILTPEQREKWNQLTVKRTLPAEPPDLPVPTEAETAQIKLEMMSPIFRAVAENTELLGLSDEQKRLLKDLKDVTRLGLFWISHRDGKAPFPPGIDGSGQADPVTRTRDEFLKHAGQVALLGILTQQQAEEIAKAVKQN